MVELDANYKINPFVPKFEPRLDNLPIGDCRLLADRLGPDFVSVIADDPSVLDGLGKKRRGSSGGGTHGGGDAVADMGAGATRFRETVPRRPQPSSGTSSAPDEGTVRTSSPLFSKEKKAAIALACRREISAQAKDDPDAEHFLEMLGACEVSRATARLVAEKYDLTLTPYQTLFDDILTFLQARRFASLVDPQRAKDDKAIAFVLECMATGRHSIYHEADIAEYVYLNFGASFVETKAALAQLADLGVTKKFETIVTKQHYPPVIGTTVFHPTKGEGKIIRVAEERGIKIAVLAHSDGTTSKFTAASLRVPSTKISYGPKYVIEAETAIARFLSDNPKRELTEDERGNVNWVLDNAALLLGKPGFVPNAEQRAAVFRAIEYRYSILNGRPGTGKTQTAALIGAAVALLFPYEDADAFGFALSGRASSVLRKSAIWLRDGIAVMMAAGTVHRMFGLSNVGEDGFLASKRVRCRVAFSDEMSMNSSTFVAAFMGALYADHVVFIGDQHQLPPIGRGAPFRDMIESGVVPTTTLVKVYRTHALGLQKLSDDILSGEISSEKIREYVRLGGVQFVGCDYQFRSEVAANCFADLFNRIPARDIKCLTPYNVGESGSRAINPLVRETLGLPEDRLAVGDEIIITHNNYEAPVPDARSDDDVEVIFNGELCRIIRRGDDFIDLEFDDDGDGIRRVRLLTKDGPNAEAQLPDGTAFGHAFSIHRGQGSQFRAVVMPTEWGNKFTNIQRGLIYTGSSRPTDLLVIVGNFDAFVDAATEPDPLRNTLLRELLELENKRQLCPA